VTDGQTDRQTDILIALSAALHYMRCCAAKSDATRVIKFVDV